MTTAAKKPSLTQQSLSELAATFGWAWQVFNSNPDLMNTLKQALDGGWDGEQFSAHVMNTNWYKTTSAATREWQILQTGDPATAKQRIAARTTTIQDTAGALGVALSAKQLQQVTSDSLLFGWTDAQVQAAIGKSWSYDPHAVQSGLAATSIQAIRKTASDYLVPLSDATMQQWGTNILEGRASAQDFTAYAQSEAKRNFAVWGNQIDAGMTVKQLADPYGQLAGQALGIDPNSIDWSQSKWRSLIDQVDPKTNQHVPLSLSDAQSKIRTDPVYGYDTSAEGTQTAAKLATTLSQMFGVE